jgi:hypothetical protein
MKEKFIQNLDMFAVCLGHFSFSAAYLRVRVKYYLFLVVSLSIFGLYLNKSFRFIVIQDEQSLGLLMSYIVGLTSLSGMLIWVLSATMRDFSSVQRIKEYVDYN